MFKIGMVVLLVALVIVFGPLLVVWSLNTLFPVLDIPYKWQTWAAAIVLFSSIGASSRGSK